MCFPISARALGENKPLHGASFPGTYTVLLSSSGLSFPGTYTVLLPSSLLREAVPVLYASLAGHSHLCALPGQNRARRCGVSKTTGRAQLALYLLKTNTMKIPWSIPPTPGPSRLLHLNSSVYYWSCPSIFHCFFEYDTITWPDVGS